MRCLHFELVTETQWEAYDAALELHFTVTRVSDTVTLLEIDDALDASRTWLRLVCCKSVRDAVRMAQEFRGIYVRNS